MCCFRDSRPTIERAWNGGPTGNRTPTNCVTSNRAHQYTIGPRWLQTQESNPVSLGNNQAGYRYISLEWWARRESNSHSLTGPVLQTGCETTRIRPENGTPTRIRTLPSMFVASSPVLRWEHGRACRNRTHSSLVWNQLRSHCANTLCEGKESEATAFASAPSCTSRELNPVSTPSPLRTR